MITSKRSSGNALQTRLASDGRTKVPPHEGGCQFREPEVQKFGPGFREHHIRRLQIAMRDAEAVRFVQRVGDLHRVLKRPVDREWTLLQVTRQRLTVEILHHEEIDAILLADIVESTNVRMVQRGDRPRLALEALAQIRVGGHVRRQDFDCDNSLEARITRPVDLSHPPGPNEPEDFVSAETNAGRERHGF